MSYDRNAYDTADMRQGAVAAQLVGLMEELLRQGHIPERHAPAVRALLAEYDQQEAAMRAALGLPPGIKATDETQAQAEAA